MSDDGTDKVWSDSFGFDAGDCFDEIVHVLDTRFVEVSVVLHITDEGFLAIAVDGDGFRRKCFLHLFRVFFFTVSSRCVV